MLTYIIEVFFMSIKRRQLSAQFKAQVALHALKEQRTVSEISKEYSVTPSKIYAWKKMAREGLSMIFSQEKRLVTGLSSEEAEKLYAEIGRLKVENSFLKKSLEG